MSIVANNIRLAGLRAFQSIPSGTLFAPASHVVHLFPQSRHFGSSRLAEDRGSANNPKLFLARDLNTAVKEPGKKVKKHSFWNLTPIYERLFRGVFTDRDVRFLASRTAALGTYAGVGSMFLGTMGVDMSAIVAGLSVGGLSIGFASKDIVSNYMSGLLLIATKPFQTGDEIIVGKPGDNIRGVVSRIDLRYLHLQCLESNATAKSILIPNSEVFKSTIHTVRRRVTLHEEDDDLYLAEDSCGKLLKLPKAVSLHLHDKIASHCKKDDNGPLSQLQPLTAEFQSVVNVAFHELGALEERALRQRYADIMFEVEDTNCQKVLLWLASDGGSTNMHRPEWKAFLNSVSAAPAWLPSAFIPKNKKLSEEDEADLQKNKITTQIVISY